MKTNPLTTLALCMSLCLTPQTLTVGQVLFSDFESGALDSWSVDGDQIRVVGPRTWTREPDSFRWLYFGAEEVADLRPEFRVPANEFLGNLAAHRFVWSYDQENWSFFDVNARIGSDYRFRNNEPFSKDEVFVAYSTPYTVSRVRQSVEALSQKWFVFPTESGNRDLVVGQSQDLPLFGFRITNPLIDAPKTKIVLVSGNHSGETGANYALEGLLEFLASDDSRAKQMRNVADFYVYPMLDPLGRTEGYYRGNSQNPLNDHNRFWDSATSGNNGGFEEIDLLTSVIRADTGADVDFTFDFHGFFASDDNFTYTDTSGTETDFLQELLRLEPALKLNIDNSTEPAGIFEFWAKTPQGLNSTFSFTPEFSPNLSVADWKGHGANYALALFAELGSPIFVTSSQEIDVLTESLLLGESDTALDLNRDGQFDRMDRVFLLSEILGLSAGDTDLNGTVDFADFLSLSGSFGTPTGWAGGDFDGNGRADFGDFLLLSGSFHQSPSVAVPEAQLMALFWLVPLLTVRQQTVRYRIN